MLITKVLGLILIMSLIVTAITYVYVELTLRKRKEQEKKEIENSLSTKKKQENKLEKAKKMLPTQEVHSDGVLAASSAVLGLVSLEIFARSRKPDYIIGVNRGGWLLSTYLTHRLDIDRDNVLRFDDKKGRILEDITSLKASCESTKKTFLVVDDISRKGDAIRKAVGYIEKEFLSSNLSVAVLVVCNKEKNSIVDYNPYWTRRGDIQLPWSSEERKKEARENITSNNVVYLNEKRALEKMQGESVVRMVNEDQGREGTDGVDISINDMEAIMNFFQGIEGNTHGELNLG
jgi:hypoxanthine phosphoribosyltransferase